MFKNPLSKHQQGGQISQEQQKMIAAFVEWLPTAVKEFQGMASEQVIEALNGMSKTEEGQKQVQGWVEQFQKELQSKQQSALFAKGGKLHAFICRHAKGGHVADCGCKEDGGKVEKNQKGKTVRNGNYEVTVNAPGDTTRTFYNKWNRQIMQTYPDGTVRYTTMSNNGSDDYQVNSWSGTPSLLRRLWFGKRQASPEKINAWNQEIADQLIDPRNKVEKNQNGSSGIPNNASTLEAYIQNNMETPNSSNLFTGKQVASLINSMHINQPLVQVSQDGGNISRNEAIELAMQNLGFTRSQALNAYANAKDALRRQGFRGKEMKQKAREMLAQRRNQTPKIDAISSGLNKFSGLLSTPEQKIVDNRPAATPNYDNMSFSNAFRAARNISQHGGAKTFNWRGKSYGTNLATTPKQNVPKLPVISDDVVIEDPEIDITIPEIKTEPMPRIPLMGTTKEARSLRTVTPTPFISELPGTG